MLLGDTIKSFIIAHTIAGIQNVLKQATAASSLYNCLLSKS